HLNVMHSRDALTQKLFISLAILGAETAHDGEAKSFLDSWATRIPRECIPYFDTMGGSWSESHGHGSYGPIQVVPYSFAAWQSATGENLFQTGKPWSYLNEMSRWLTYLQVLHNGCLAYLDDGGGGYDGGFAQSAFFVARSLRDPLAQWFSDQAQARDGNRWLPWQRVVGTDPTLKAKSPGELKLPLGYLLQGAGHVFMRSAWDDPNATWAFFGAGPHRVGHQHDDEGHFMISSRGGLVSKGAGQGSNDEDHYWGGSLAFNVLTIFDPQETFRRNVKNENDGGLLRYVYDETPHERGSMVAFTHNADITYAAADLTRGYNPSKVKEVTRQFLYLRAKPGDDEFFVVCDRVVSAKASFAKHFMLHVPEEPSVSGTATVRVPDHVSDYSGTDLTSTWLSLPGDFGPDAEILAKGRSRMFLRTLLPKDAVITKRGGDGHQNWGHPLEATAQYDHVAPGRAKPPFCRWRVEVAAPLAEQTMFLHVFQVTKEGTTTMAPVTLVEDKPQVRLEIGPAGRQWKVSLPTSGALTANVTPPGKAEIRIPASVEVAEQYGQAKGTTPKR
ncbi:MAG TPA: heparinase II/III family protein, partial [Planctomycetota bacterium]|nr:heparinase II/III family protein [Planctomycetota bacterium]